MQILHISDVEVRETKMMGTSPIIIVAVGISLAFYYEHLKLFWWKQYINGPPWESLQFQTQQVYCVRSADGSIKEGGKVNAVSFMHHILHMCNTNIFFLFLIGNMCNS